MARWEPDPNQPFGPAEHIGRRLFDEPMLMGAEGQKPYAGLNLRNFEETRGDDFSLDRLGRTSIEKAVVKYLKPLAGTAGQTFHTAKRFDGWVVVPIRTLTSPARGAPLPLIASPDDDNPYHAHLLTKDLLVDSGDLRHYHVALHLRELFLGQGSSIHRAHGQPAEAQRESPSQKLLPTWLQRWWVKLRSLVQKRQSPR